MSWGIQKWALVAYIVISVYLIGKPSPKTLEERAHILDQQLIEQSPELLAPALADALEMPVSLVDCLLQEPNSRPSSLVFNKLLLQTGSQPSEENAAEVILKTGIPMQEAIAYFDTVERRVNEGLAQAAPTPTNRGNLIPGNNAAQLFGARSNRPDSD